MKTKKTLKIHNNRLFCCFNKDEMLHNNTVSSHHTLSNVVCTPESIVKLTNMIMHHPQQSVTNKQLDVKTTSTQTDDDVLEKHNIMPIEIVKNNGESVGLTIENYPCSCGIKSANYVSVQPFVQFKLEFLNEEWKLICHKVFQACACERRIIDISKTRQDPEINFQMTQCGVNRVCFTILNMQNPNLKCVEASTDIPGMLMIDFSDIIKDMLSKVFRE